MDFKNNHILVALEIVIKLILIIFIEFNLKYKQFNIITAYLNTKLKTGNIFIR